MSEAGESWAQRLSAHRAAQRIAGAAIQKHELSDEQLPSDAERAAMKKSQRDGATLRRILIHSGKLTPIEMQSRKDLEFTMAVIDDRSSAYRRCMRRLEELKQ